MKRNPFKFLDSYTKNDKNIFFGRERETEELYQKVFESKILLIYGITGTGKTSLINCGLANKFNDSDWLPIYIRRNQNILDSVINELSKYSYDNKENKNDKKSILKLLQSVYLDNFKPIYLLFDQFEELFIFGNKDERKAFVELIDAINQSDIQCKCLFILREEFLANITEFEKTIPAFFHNRIRIEKMTPIKAIETIKGPCKAVGIEIQDEAAEDILHKVSKDESNVELTYLQVLLDKVYQLASEGNKDKISITREVVNKIGDVEDILGDFLEQQIKTFENSEDVLNILKSFVSVHGTKKQVSKEEINEHLKTFGQEVNNDQLSMIINQLISRRVLKEKDEQGHYELIHDALAAKIYEKISLVEKEILEIREFIENAYRNYQNREVLLSKKDLSYISPYEDKMYLNSKLQEFIKISKVYYERLIIRRKRITILTISIIAFLAILFGFYTFKQQKKAELEAKIQKSKNLANKALQYLDSDPTLTYLISEEAYKTYSTSEAEKGLINSYKNAPFYNLVNGSDILISNSKKYFLIRNTKDNILRLYDYTGKLKTEFKGHTGRIMLDGYKFSKDEKHIITQSVDDSTIRVWDINGKEVFQIDCDLIFDIFPEDYIYIIKDDRYLKMNYLGDTLGVSFFKDSITEFSLNDGILFTKNKSGRIKIRDANENKIISTLDIEKKLEFDIVDYTNKYVVLKSKDVIMVWDIINDKINKLRSDKDIIWVESKIEGQNLYFTLLFDGGTYSYWGYSLLNNSLFKFKGNRRFDNYFDAEDYLANSVVILNNEKIGIKGLNVIINSEGKVIHELNKNFKFYNSRDKLFYTGDRNIVSSYNLKFKEVYKINIKDFEINSNYSFLALSQSNINLLYDSKNCYIFDDKGKYINTIKLIHDFNIQELRNGYCLFENKEYAKRDYYIFKFDNNYFTKRRLINGSDHQLQYYTNDFILTSKDDSLHIWNANLEFVGKKRIGKEFYIKKFEYDSIHNRAGLLYDVYVETDSYLSYFKPLFEVVSISNLQTLYSSEPNTGQFAYNFIEDNKEVCLVIFEDSLLKYFNYDFKIIDSWGVGKLISTDTWEYTLYMDDKYLIGVTDDFNEIHKCNYLKKMENIFKIDKNTYQSNISILSNNGILIGYYDFIEGYLQLLNNKKRKVGTSTIKGDVVYGNSMINYNPNYNALAILSFTQDLYFNPSKEMRITPQAPSFLTLYDIKQKKEIFNYSFNQFFDKIYYMSTDDERIFMGDKNNMKCTYIDFNGYELLGSDELKADKFKLRPDGQYLIYEVDQFIDILPLKPQEIIKRVRKDKEFGEIRKFTEQEKIEFGIN